eukprot:TRINITY_DN28912_c0_g1_i2.p1 TRINITY_DN28912_c0_g1~~TRINITY_DN28912_c0_g1_i2.p1  ORF type:complete len:441 (-),score=45.01 TRINITY_DN28912_c0_g1_i2:315-1637(-)
MSCCAANVPEAREAWSNVVPDPETASGAPAQDVQDEENTESSAKRVGIVCFWVAAGFIEGFLMVKSMVVFPAVMADQFVFKNFVVLKMFLSAVGSSMVFQAVFALKSPDVFAKTRKHARFRYGYGRVIGGLCLVGVGMGVSGSGPTLIFPSMGARVRSSAWLFAGATLAVLAVGAIDKLLAYLGVNFVVGAAPLRHPPNIGRQPEERLPSPEGRRELVQPKKIEELLGLLLARQVSYGAIALANGLTMLALCVYLEIVVDFRDDVVKYMGALPTSSSAAWPPSLLGLVIGIGQIPVRLIHGDGRGASGSFVTLASTLTFDQVFKGTSLQASFSNGFSGWQFVYNFIIVMAGAFCASWTSGIVAVNQESNALLTGSLPVQAFVGMFISIIGAIYAGGCTCGHGVSGVSELALESWLGTAFIFPCAICARNLLVFMGWEGTL